MSEKENPSTLDPFYVQEQAMNAALMEKRKNGERLQIEDFTSTMAATLQHCA